MDTRRHDYNDWSRHARFHRRNQLGQFRVNGAEVVSLGCRLNLAEGEALRREHADAEDLIIINSCAVTAEAERQARQAIRRAARRRPEARILVAGCAAQAQPGQFLAMPEVSGITRRADTLRPAVSGASHARAFVEVQNGCDHDCTFCITTIARGASRSIPGDAVVDAVRQAVDRGQQEVVLTGVDLTSYAAPSLGALVERILTDVPDLPRLRLSSLDSIEIDDRLFDLITGEARVMPHVHLSLQSGDDMILKRMKRRHTRAEAVRLVDRLKTARPDIAIGADLIAGFPTETETMFANSLRLVEDCDIVLAHIFPYSPRPGTAAARMPQLGRAVAKARAERLRAAASMQKAAWLQTLIGTTQTVLVELDGQTGHAGNFAPVRLERPVLNRNMRGRMMHVRITASDGDVLAGVPA
jgi:threonylcarbamoyladenosine tRNA methylthiotransferase MtaB